MTPARRGCIPAAARGYGSRVRPSAADNAAGSAHGFPAALTRFVGRGGAVDEVAGLLDQSRLVTLTGPGGAGKTRLAGEVAKQVAGRFADGVWLTELAAVRDPAQVPAAVAAALGIPEQPGAATADALARALARQQLLLVLDNCEQVIGAVAVLCAGLLPACDDVRIVATSREPLRVDGEARYRLAPLTLPSPDNPADLNGSEAVALFTDRARLADASFTLDAETGPVVARLVARLDGMPLAIELAAARVEALGVAQLLDRIDDRFGLLVAGDRLAARRHRSLAATVEWSYRLLDDDEQQVFRAVSAFPGPFTLAGAEAVAGAGTGPAVLRLVECSLLVPPRAGPDGRSRLTRARDAGDLWSLGNLLEKMTVLDLNAGRFQDAAAHLREGLQISLRTGVRANMLDDLDCCGYLCAMTGRCEEALTIWAAVVMLQGYEGFRATAHPDVPRGWFQRQEALREARQALGPDRVRAAEDRGEAMSLATAAEYALMLTAVEPPPAEAPAGTPGAPAGAPGVGRLSARERELVTLVAQGRTDAQIAAQLYISVRTVSSHLDRIRDKTGCRRRADLTRLALASGLV
jgi:predicted ATPase/DNA-binding CsgD family transcriptional regulator